MQIKKKKKKKKKEIRESCDIGNETDLNQRVPVETILSFYYGLVEGVFVRFY